MKSRKKEAAAFRAQWSERLAAGFVLRFNIGAGHLTSYPDTAARDRALQEATEAGIPCEVVTYP